MYCIVPIYCLILYRGKRIPAGHVPPEKRQMPMNVDNAKSQMRKGMLEYCVMLLLRREPSYASDIIARLKEADLIVVEGTLYPLLTRLKKDGLLSYEWRESTQGVAAQVLRPHRRWRGFLGRAGQRMERTGSHGSPSEDGRPYGDSIAANGLITLTFKFKRQ